MRRFRRKKERKEESAGRREHIEQFQRLYARWERTHNLELVPLLCYRLEQLLRLEPGFNPRQQFASAF